jgi:hypothetical protein
MAIEEIPSASIRFSSPSWVALLRYQQRWYWRNPNIGNRDLPLLYHTLMASYSRALTARLSTSAHLTASYGSLDYAAFSTYTVPSATAQSVPQFGIAQTATSTADLGLTYQLTPRLSWGIGLTAFRRETINRAEVAPGLGTAQSIGVTSTATYRATNRTELTASAGGTHIDVESRPPTRTVVGQLRLGHQLSPTSMGFVSAGLTYLLAAEPGATFVYPMAQAGFTKSTGREGHRLTWGVTAGLFANVDYISGRTLRVATFAANASQELGDRWTATGILGTTVPTSQNPAGTRLAETSGQASLVFARPIGNHAEFTTGIRHLVRMTHPNATPFEVLDRQTWVFAGLAVWLATPDGSNGRWAL